MERLATISLCMIVKNEEKHLASCLESANGVVDEIIIADTGSTDRTVEIARSFTPNIFSIEWEGDFAAARNHSLARATGDWILVLDADEVLEHWPVHEVRELLTITAAGGFVIPIVNVMDKGDRLLHGAVMRLFRRDRDVRFRGIVHEDVGPSLLEKGWRIEAWPYSIRHYGYMDAVVQDKDKRNRNMTLLNEQLASEPENPFIWHNLGNEYLAMRELGQAAACYEKALSYAPERAFYLSHTMRSLLDIYIDTGRLREALELVKQAINTYPDYTDLYYLLGIILMNSGQPDKSVTWFQRCLQMKEAPIQHPKIDGVTSYLSMYGLAFAYRRLGNLQETVMYCVQALKRNPVYVQALDLLVEVLLTQESRQVVAHFVRKMVDPEHEGVRSILQKHQLT